VKLQDPVPVHPAPLQPAKTLPPNPVAERFIELPTVELTAQVDPQLIPPPDTVPAPVPAFKTEIVEI